MQDLKLSKNSLKPQQKLMEVSTAGDLEVSTLELLECHPLAKDLGQDQSPHHNGEQVLCLQPKN